MSKALLGIGLLLIGVLFGALALLLLADLFNPSAGSVWVIIPVVLALAISVGLIVVGSNLVTNRQPQTPRSRAWWPIVIVMLLLVSYCGLIGLPDFVQARATSSTNACINNQRQIESAIQQYALEQSVAAGTPVPGEDIIGGYIKGGMPVCPKGGVHYLVSGTIDDIKIVCPNARVDPHGHTPLYP